MKHIRPVNSQFRFHLPSEDRATLRLCSRPRLSLFWISPLSHVKQRFVHSNETPTVVITFPVCHTAAPPLSCCLFWQYWDNGCLFCLNRYCGSGSTPFSYSPFLSLSTRLLLPAPHSSCTLMRRRWRGRWHGSTHLIQLLQKQWERSSPNHEM